MGLRGSREVEPEVEVKDHRVEFGDAAARARYVGDSVKVEVAYTDTSGEDNTLLTFVYDAGRDPFENSGRFRRRIVEPLYTAVEDGIEKNVVIIKITFQDDYIPVLTLLTEFVNQVLVEIPFPRSDELGIIALMIAGHLDVTLPRAYRRGIYTQLARLAKHIARRRLTAGELRQAKKNGMVAELDSGLIVEDDETPLIREALVETDLPI
jgi:hypothetical protein